MRVKYETWSQSVSPHLTCDSLTCDYRTPTSDLVAKPAKPLVGRPSVRACVPRTARRRLATRLQAGRCVCRPDVGVCFDLLSVCLSVFRGLRGTLYASSSEAASSSGVVGLALAARLALAWLGLG